MIRAVGSYGLISGACFLLNNALLIALDWAGFPLWLNLALSAAVVITAGYLLLSAFTFRRPLSWPAFGRYSLVMLPNVPVAWGLLWLLNHWLPMYYSAPIVTALLLIWNAAGSVWALKRVREMA